MWSMPVVVRRLVRRVRQVRPTLALPSSERRSRVALPSAESRSGVEPPGTAAVGDEGPVLAAGLTAFGLGTGSRIALMGLAPDGDRAVAEAIALLGADVVIVPDHANGPRLRLRLRGVRAVLTREGCVPQIAAVVGDLPDLQHLWSWDAGGRDELVAAAYGRMPAFQE